MLVPSSEELLESAPSPPPPLPFFSSIESNWLAEFRAHPQFRPIDGQSSDFDLLRWANAYKGDIETTVRKYRRHIHIREILRLDQIENFGKAEGLDEDAENYAPMDILGQVGQTDGRILLLERSGNFDLEKMMKSIQTSSFMLNRFRLMERILGQIRRSEEKTGQRQSAILVMDLAGIRFHAGLVGFISGPYRIMWGTLVEQYPSILSSILVINCPPSISVLWSACASFLGDEYRQRVHLLGKDWQQRIVQLGLLQPEAMPIEHYGGLRPFPSLRVPQPCKLLPLELAAEDAAELEMLSIPAGEFLIRTYFLQNGEQLQFVIGHEQELTFNILFSRQKRLIRAEEIIAAGEGQDYYGQEKEGNRERLVEVFAGCERPGMPGLDSWRWIVPRTGFFHLALGNEKAWLLPVSLKFQLFQVHSNGQKVRMATIPSEHLRGQA